jgi:peptidoglycan/xylan/chitin deacetylase (PgdA/CDA1 family)
MTDKPTASLSLDLDNVWSYLKTHGDPDWEHRPSYLRIAVPRVLDLFGQHGLQATVFVIGADAAREDGAKAVAEFYAAGHEIGNHSFEHEPWLHRYPAARLAEEVRRTEEAIVAAGAPRPSGFRGPGFSVPPALLKLLMDRGYDYDASTLPTWIGPLARAYHFRTSRLTKEQRDERAALFGSAREALQPIHPYEWNRPGAAGLVEIPVTTMPLARVPIHGSYLVQLHSYAPRLARTYLGAALRLCRIRGVGPSMLLHPTDLLDHRDAPQLAFFPGMAVPAAEKTRLMSWTLAALRRHFDLVGTGEHARRLRAAGLARSRPVRTAPEGAAQ